MKKSQVPNYGWILTNNEQGETVIQKDDEKNVFNSDEEAVDFVVKTYFELVNILEKVHNTIIPCPEIEQLLNKVKRKTYQKPCEILYHVFTNNIDEHTQNLEEAIMRAQTFIEEYGCARIYKQEDWDEEDGIFQDGDCIFSFGEYPV